MLSSATFLAAAVQCAASIHPSTAFDVARVESGFNPYAIAEIVPTRERASGSPGVISHQPATQKDALSIVRRIVKKGRRYSVGLMQITSTNFRRYDVTARELLTPCVNLSVFERILTDCYRRGGTLKKALSCYYTGNFHSGQQAESSFNHTSYVQRIGYVVPSTRDDPRTGVASVNTADTHYPAKVLRGDLSETTTAASPPLNYPGTIIRGDLPLPVISKEK